jgi:hypothetical protein
MIQRVAVPAVKMRVQQVGSASQGPSHQDARREQQLALRFQPQISQHLYDLTLVL